MGAVCRSVLHVTGLVLTAPSQNCMQPAQLQTQTQTTQTDTDKGGVRMKMLQHEQDYNIIMSNNTNCMIWPVKQQQQRNH